MWGPAKIKDAISDATSRVESLNNTAGKVLAALVIVVGLLCAAVVALTTAVHRIGETVES